MENAVKFYICVGVPVSLMLTAIVGAICNLMEEHNLFTNAQGQKFLLRVFCIMMSITAVCSIVGVR